MRSRSKKRHVPATCQLSRRAVERWPHSLASRSIIGSFLEDDSERQPGRSADLIESLEPFLEGGTDAAAVRAAVPELLGAVAGAGAQPPHAWLGRPATPARADAAQLQPQQEVAFGAGDESTASPVAALFAARSSGLNVGAPEFKQPAAAAATNRAPQPAAEEELIGAAAQLSLAHSDGGWEHSQGLGGQAAAPRQRSTWGGGGQHAGGGFPAALPPGQASDDAFLSVLAQQFSEYSLPALRTLFAQCNGDLPATVDAICSLEAELSGQMHAAYAAMPPPPAAAPPQPDFTADDFPSLGGGTAAAAAAPKPYHVGNYAGRARAAAALPTPAAGPSTAAWHTNGGASGGGGGAAAAPVWRAEGVQQFTTGAAAAAEYADARADARDFARLRNACFQQATAAYLSGNKALAKELGRQGRQHNEAMKAAHAAAASETFVRRNAGAMAAGGAGGGVPTIDLHALHVSEALQQLERALGRLHAGGARVARVVVGVGQHGKVPARLPAAVRASLDDWGLRYREVYAGLLEVRLV